ncbi:hypothetical protein BC831DRAFT_447149 [Entophlyctis helioformis]|nr:hypothetical protein BC831DRAFT_447149 [Entophlyctis helioformis]
MPLLPRTRSRTLASALASALARPFSTGRSLLRSASQPQQPPKPAPPASASASASASAPSASSFASRPGPMPLGNKKDQDEFETLVRKAEASVEADLAMGHRHPDAEREPLQAFDGDRNPRTGEVGGPKGAEPTRYGDWERKGRVFDF